MKVFFSNYHISVNSCFVDDLSAIGLEVVMPNAEFAKGRIGFFAPNDEHVGKTGVSLVSYEQFMKLEPIAIVIPCNQMYEDFMRLYEQRGKVDTLVFLPALSNSIDTFDLAGSDFVISHDLTFHRMSKAKYKVLYFNKPKVMIRAKVDYEKVFREKKIKLYINNFDKEGFEPEYEAANELNQKLALRSEFPYPKIPFYGYGMADGWLSMKDTQRSIVDSMFTLVFKRRETWGQMVNESMLLGTPCIFLRKFINSTFTEYLITPDTAIVCDTLDEIVDRLNRMTFEEYETLCVQAQTMSEMYTDSYYRQKQLVWLFDKVIKEMEVRNATR